MNTKVRPQGLPHIREYNCQVAVSLFYYHLTSSYTISGKHNFANFQTFKAKNAHFVLILLLIPRILRTFAFNYANMYRLYRG